MTISRADVLLHPVRLRIIQALELGERRTVQQLAQILKDVPKPSLYRHLNKLLEGGFVRVVEERPVGGAVERVFAMVDGAGLLPVKELASATKKDHMRYFAAFCAMMMSKFDQYLDREHIDFVADRVGYRTSSIYLSDDELDELIKEMQSAVQKVVHNKPAPGRRRRFFATVLMPEDNLSEEEESHNDAS